MNPVDRLIDVIGNGHYSVAGRKLGVSGNAVRKWQRKGRLPRTEWTGETSYARKAVELSEGELTLDELLPSDPPIGTCAA